MAEATGEADPPPSPRERLLLLLLRAAIGLTDLSGVEASLRFGSAFGHGWRLLYLPRVRRVRKQLAAALPQETTRRRREIERDVFVHLGRGLAELLILSGRHRHTLLERMEIEGLEHLERAVRESGGRGAILLGAHLGNWEIAAARLAEMGVPVSAIYRGFRQPAFDRAIRRVREGIVPMASPKGDPIQQIPMGPRAGVQFIRAIAAGRTVLVLLDQHARASEGILTTFFDQPALTRFGPLKLSDRTGAPILPAFARRDPDGRHHRLTIHPPLQLEAGASDDENVLRRNLQRVTAELELAIRQTPGQWIWTHRRWRVPTGRNGVEPFG